jgi:hypothetical protein
MADIRTSSLGGTPFGNTASRPSSPSIGQTYNNGETGVTEIYTGSVWIANSATPAIPEIDSVSQSNSQSTYSSTSSVSVSFTAGSGGGLVDQYKVVSSPGNLSATGSSSPITVTGLTNGTGYTFTALAKNSFGTSNSSVGSLEITPITVPQAPTINSLTRGSGQVSVGFSPNATGGSAITSYTATSSPGGFTASGSSSPLLVTGLTNGTSYTFTVTATNAVGTSVASSQSASVTALSNITAEVMLIAGGGSGGYDRGAGGGAGGLVYSSSTNLSVGSTYSIVIGAGATGQTGYSSPIKGNNSTMTGVTTAVGGGGGVSADSAFGGDQNGGSGGGGAGSGGTAGGTATAGQGNAGGVGNYSPPNYGGGGGGGAGSVGGNGTSTTGGNGGSGSGSYSAWASATSTGVGGYYAGGGGGGTYSGGTAGSGGAGGGGAGRNGGTGLAGFSGTTNTGGGGGGGSGLPQGGGGAGGSGICIIRYSSSTPEVSSTTGSPSVVVSGGYRYYTFTSNGSVTI